MGVIGKDFLYKKIENFLTVEELKLIKEYTVIKHRLFSLDPFQYTKTLHTTWYHGEALTDALLLTKKELIEKEIGKKLLPGYSFWRMYTKSDYLEIHRDRPACEISLSIRIDGDTDWLLYFDKNEQPKGGEGVNLKNGDAVVYLGEKLWHWRDPLKGDFQSQVFLHFVDADGPYRDHHLDKRQALGIELR